MSNVSLLQHDLSPQEALKLANAHLENGRWIERSRRSKDLELGLPENPQRTEESAHPQNPQGTEQAEHPPERPQRTEEFEHAKNGQKTDIIEIILMLCDEALVALCRMKEPTLNELLCSKCNHNQFLREKTAEIFSKHSMLLKKLERPNTAKIFSEHGMLLKKLEHPNTSDEMEAKLRQCIQGTQSTQSSRPSKFQFESMHDVAKIPPHIFAENTGPPTIPFKVPGERLESTSQLVYCLRLLKGDTVLSEDTLEQSACEWVNQIDKERIQEKIRLEEISSKMTEEFINDRSRNPQSIAEIVSLSQVLEKDEFLKLLGKFNDSIKDSSVLNLQLLQGLAQLIEDAKPDYLEPDNLIVILTHLKDRLGKHGKQSKRDVYQLTATMSAVLKTAASAEIDVLNNELREPILAFLSTASEDLKKRLDFHLAYQVAYAQKALESIKDGTPRLIKTLQQSGKVIKSVIGLAKAVKDIDVDKLFDGLKDLERGFEPLLGVYKDVQAAYATVVSLLEESEQVVDAINGGFSYRCQETWYQTLRIADDMLRYGRLAEFKKLVCEVPCRRNPLFQWGVCQRLGEVAANSLWGVDTCQGAVDFLGEIYQNDKEWGRESNVKQGIVQILMQLVSPHGGDMQ
ncbi:hypothetical protein BGZ65_002642, partial [Modicella reniformis]